MPWQEQIADVAMELMPDGQLAYREIGVTVARQNGKTSLVLPLECHRSVLWKGGIKQSTIYSAQTGQDGRDKFLQDQKPIIEASALKALRRRWYESAGHESLVWNNGSIIRVQGHAMAAGHGKTTDLGIVDEAFADIDERREQSMKPGMKTRQDAQLWWLSTAGDESSVYLQRKVDMGRAAVLDGVERGIAYFEYSAEEGCDSGDREAWYAANPALGYTITEEVLEYDHKTMTDDDFRRADLNLFTKNAAARVIPAVLWSQISRTDLSPAKAGLVLAVEASTDRLHSVIVGMDHERQGGVLAYRAGMAGLADEVVRLVAKYAAVVVAIDAKGPASMIIPDLEGAGIPVAKYGPDETAKACARLYDAIAENQLAVRADVALDDAVAGARRRMIGDQWVWSRRDAKTDVAPLVALTLAYDASVNTERQTGLLWVAS